MYFSDYRMALRMAVLLLLCFNTGRLYAQDSTCNITPEQAVEAALANNREVRLAQLNEKIARSGYNQTAAVYLPQVAFSYTAMTTNAPLNAFGFKLQQRIITQNNFDPHLLNHPSGTADVTTQLEVQQPVLNIDKWYMRKEAARQAEAAAWSTVRTHEYLIFEVRKAWQQLRLAWQGVTILEQALATADTVYTFTNNRYQQGYVQKSDLLNALVQIKTVESQLNKAKSNRYDAADYLGLLMGRKAGVLYNTTGTIQTILTCMDTLQHITAARSDFMAMNKLIEAGRYQVMSTQMSYLPQLNAFGNFQYNDKQLVGFGANAYFAGIQLSWKIFNGNSTKNTIARQKLELDQQQQQLEKAQEESRLELAKARRSYSDALFEIAQYEAAIEQATESLRVLQNRYQQSLVNTTDVLMAATQLSQQQLALAQARCNLAVTADYIQLLTSTTNQ